MGHHNHMYGSQHEAPNDESPLNGMPYIYTKTLLDIILNKRMSAGLAIELEIELQPAVGPKIPMQICVSPAGKPNYVDCRGIVWLVSK
jgi:hypothetical protein